MLRAERICTDFILKHQFNFSARGLSTKSANRKLGWPRGRWYDKDEQAVGFRGALFGYFLGKQKVTRKTRRRRVNSWWVVSGIKGTRIEQIERIGADLFLAPNQIRFYPFDPPHPCSLSGQSQTWHH